MKKLLLALSAISSLAFGQMGSIDQQYSNQISIIANPGFENGISRWEITGSGTLQTTSTASQVYLGAVSGVWDASASGEFLRSRLSNGTIQKGLENVACEASFYYLWDAGVPGDLIARVTDGTTALSSDVIPNPTSGNFAKQTILFTCPDQGDNIRMEFESVADNAAITLDGFHVGNLLPVTTNVLPVVYADTDTKTNYGGDTGTITHGKNIPVQDQNWIVVVEEDGVDSDIILDNGWITDMDPNSVDFDFTGLAGADIITVKLQDTRDNSDYTNNLGKDFTYGPSGTAPAASIPHGLGNIPKSLWVFSEGPVGQFKPLDAGSYCSVTNADLLCDFGSLTIDATHRIFIGVSLSVNPGFLDGSLNLNDLTVADLTVTNSGSIADLETSGNTALGGSGAPTGDALASVGNSSAGGPIIQQVVGVQSAYCHNVRYDSGWKSVTSGELGCIRMDAGTGAIQFHYGSAAGADETQSNFDLTNGDIKARLNLDGTVDYFDESRRIRFTGSNTGSGYFGIDVCDHDGTNCSSRDLYLEQIGGGDVILNVQTDGVAANGLCPDGGDVCSGATAGSSPTCTNQVNVASCTISNIEYTRVGNVVTASLIGSLAHNSGGGAVSFRIAAPGNTTNFGFNEGGGTCAWGGGGVQVVVGNVDATVSTQDLTMEFNPQHPSALTLALRCSFSYRSK
jgi:hypothetical protein